MVSLQVWRGRGSGCKTPLEVHSTSFVRRGWSWALREAVEGGSEQSRLASFAASLARGAALATPLAPFVVAAPFARAPALAAAGGTQVQTGDINVQVNTAATDPDEVARITNATVADALNTMVEDHDTIERR